jgi:hypothetical protein
MKTKLYLLLMLQILSYELLAGSISGEISYSGISAGTIVVAAFTAPTLDNDPVFMTSITTPGSYSFTDVNDGTYYIVSVMTNNPDQILITDPYGFWGTLDNLTPVIISGSNNAPGINITLVDGTVENPNPFASYYITPDQVIQLPSQTINGESPSLVFDGTSIYLYKHDYSGAPSAKIFVINPESGALLNTYILSLESSPNKISWIDKMVYRNGDLWATGGYGDPLGSGYIEGVFKMDIVSNTSSSQKPYSQYWRYKNGLTCDGTNLFISVADSNSIGGIIKFNPDGVTSIPSNLFINLGNRARHLSFGDGFLWAGIDKVNKFNPVTGEFLGVLDLPGSAAELFFDGKFWTYDESHNTILVYYLSMVGINENNVINSPNNFSLSQNYPNPFNPNTKISWQLPISSIVTLKVYDVLGNEIAILVNEHKLAGSYEVNFDASNLSSGIYFYQIKTGSFIQTKKMTLIK